MKTKLLSIGLLLAVNCSLWAQTADDYVSQGRAFLSASNIIAANDSFSHAVALSPNHQTANVFYATTRLLVLPSQPAGSNFLNRLGVPVEGRDIYNWTAEPPTDTNGVPLAPAGVNASEFTAMLRTNVLPSVIAAEANLARVTGTNFLLDLTASETHIADVTLDYGDLLMLRAMLQAAEYFAYSSYSWNLEAQLSAIHSLYTNDETSIERVLMDYPNLLTFATTNDLNVAKQAFQDGVELYMAASQFIRNRSTNVTRLFNYDAEQAEDEEQFRSTLIDLTNSLLSAVTMAVDTNYTIFLASHFSGMHSVRSAFPRFRENAFLLGTLPDNTFGGLIYGLSSADIEEFLAEHLDAIPSILPPFNASGGNFQFPVGVLRGRAYGIQVSTNLTSWSNYLAFISLSNTFSFTDSNTLSLSRRFYRLVDSTGDLPPIALILGNALGNLAGASGSQTRFVVTVPAGRSSLLISISGGTGDCDLYVRFSSEPTLSLWDYRPYLGGNNESVAIPNPVAGDWHIMLHGFESYSGVTLTTQ